MPKKGSTGVAKGASKKVPAVEAQETSPNIAALIKAKVMPDTLRLSTSERAALDSLSKSEISAIIAIKTKMGNGFFKSQAAHAMYY